MHCELRTAEKTLFSGEASLIVARSPRGEFGVMEGHAPLLAVLIPAPLRVKTKDREHEFAVAAGLLRVDEDGVVILAQDAVPKEEIDMNFVRAKLAELSAATGAAGELAFLRVQERIGGGSD